MYLVFDYRGLKQSGKDFTNLENVLYNKCFINDKTNLPSHASSKIIIML